MSSGRRARVCVAGLLGAAPACGALFGVDFADRREPSPIDGGGDAIVARTDEREDAGEAVAPRREGAAGRVDAGARFCASQSHLFCADFDEDNLYRGWAGSPLQLGSAKLDTTESVSPPASFAARVSPADAAAQLAYAQLAQGFPVKGGAVHYAFDARIDSCSANAADITIATVSTSAISATGFALLPDVGTFILFEQVGSVDGGLGFTHANQFGIGSVVLGTWLRVTIDVILGSTHSSYTVRVHRNDDSGDDEVANIGTGSPASIDDGGVTTYLGLFSGAASDSGIGPCLIHIDNFTLDVDP